MSVSEWTHKSFHRLIYPDNPLINLVINPFFYSKTLKNIAFVANGYTFEYSVIIHRRFFLSENKMCRESPVDYNYRNEPFFCVCVCARRWGALCFDYGKGFISNDTISRFISLEYTFYLRAFLGKTCFCNEIDNTKILSFH